ncbi:MAG: class II aldolase/adducin family protein [Phycisphaerales bacterium]|nr:MAG: class II aldolase/adducin family protein [Phycisphaerales bacterium]
MMNGEWNIKKEICEIGRRLYARGFAAGNDGNISCRLSDNVVLCTPTQICKGFMKPDDLCTVDLNARQTLGRRQPTSEILLHLEIYRADPAVRAAVHCHPPHATAFGVARVDIPSCILPEVEVFLGVVPRAEYETPGGKSFAETVRPFIGKANTVVLSNHGTVSWGPTVERAYWYTEILDAYCRMLILAEQIGHVERLPGPKVKELLKLKERFGAGIDPRLAGNAELCVNMEFGDGVAPARAPGASPEAAPGEPDEFENLVQSITAHVVDVLRRQ